MPTEEPRFVYVVEAVSGSGKIRGYAGADLRSVTPRKFQQAKIYTQWIGAETRMKFLNERRRLNSAAWWTVRPIVIDLNRPAPPDRWRLTYDDKEQPYVIPADRLDEWKQLLVHEVDPTIPRYMPEWALPVGSDLTFTDPRT